MWRKRNVHTAKYPYELYGIYLIQTVNITLTETSADPKGLGIRRTLDGPLAPMDFPELLDSIARYDLWIYGLLLRVFAQLANA